MAIQTLDNLIEEVKNEIPVEIDKKFIDIEISTVVTILVFQGLKIFLPELKEWIKLGFSVIALKRLELEKNLENYALEKELNYGIAEKASKKIVENITEQNISRIIDELEQKS